MDVGKEASSLFQTRSFTECLALLQQLLLKKDNDPKILHNIALVEFHKDGCTDPSKLLQALTNVKTRCEELTKAADEQLEGIGNNISSSPPGSTAAVANSETSTSVSLDTVGYIEDYDTSIPLFNTAVILYHLQQHESALAVLDSLFSNIEPVDEAVALRICLLMLDISLDSSQPVRAAKVLRYMEKTSGFGGPPATPENTSSSHSYHPAAATSTAHAPPSNSDNALDSKSLSVGISPIAVSSSLMNSPNADSNQNSAEETFEEDALSIGLEIDGSHSVRSSVLPPISRLPPIEKSSPAPATDMKLLLHLYRVRYLMLLRNFKAAKREVKFALNLSRDNLTALLLKAQLEYYLGNYRKSLKLLTTCNNRNEPAMAPVILTNFACVNYQIQHPHTATYLFCKAMEKFAALYKERPLKLWASSEDKSLSVLYNCGLVQLTSGKPLVAARCFQDCGGLYRNKPVFWLRLAECCISALENGLIRNDSTSKHEEEDSNEEITFGGDPYKLSLVFARRCLRHALSLLDRTELESDVGEMKEEADAVQSSNSSSRDGTGTDDAVLQFEEERKQEKEMLRLSSLLDSAFVELCLENHLESLKASENLLKHPLCTRTHTLLGRIYAAESLCCLGRMKDAEQLLSDSLRDWSSDDVSSSSGSSNAGDNGEAATGSDGWRFSFGNYTSVEARTTLYGNLSVVHVLQGDLVQARQFALQALSSSSSSSAAAAANTTLPFLSIAYVELVQGNFQEAMAVLKRCRSLSLFKLRTATISSLPPAAADSKQSSLL